MRKNVAHAKHAVDFQPKWRELETKSAYEDLDTLTLERLAGTPGTVPQILKGYDPIDATDQTGDNQELCLGESHRSSFHGEKISLMLDVQARVVIRLRVASCERPSVAARDRQYAIGYPS